MRKAILKDRPKVSITMRIPVDVVEDLKQVAPHKGITGYQGLIKFYIGQGLRKDMEQYNIISHADRELGFGKAKAEKAREILQRGKVDPALIQEVLTALS